METLQETALRFRDAANANIKKYCEDNNCPEDFDHIKNYLIQQADKFNTKLPVDFYKDFYNQTVELLKS
jgi:hydrogenase maturation factor HypE